MNNQIFYFFYSLAHKSSFLDWVIVFFADTFPYIVVMLAGLFILFHHEIFQAENPFQVFMQKKKEMFYVALSLFLAWALSYILKISFHTPRPFDALTEVVSLFPESGYAFPSMHSAFFMALAFAIYFTHKKAGYVFMGFALLVGLARISSGVHFPVDIFGGFVLGALISYCVHFLASFGKSV